MTCMAMSGNGSRIAGTVSYGRPTTAGAGPRGRMLPPRVAGRLVGLNAVGCAFRDSLQVLDRIRDGDGFRVARTLD